MRLFVTFLFLAVVRIRQNDSDAHARYMAGTVLFALEPELEKVFVFYVPGVSGFASALNFGLITMELITGGTSVLRVATAQGQIALCLGTWVFRCDACLLDAGCELCGICRLCQMV
jgi:hypothetical protein